jgi:hypothetical protein
MIAAFIFEAVLRRLTRDPTGPSEGPLGPGEHCPFPWGRCGQARLTDFGGADGSM